MPREALRAALALLPLLGAAAFAPPLSDAPFPALAFSLAALAWLRSVAWTGGRGHGETALLLAAGLPFRAWAWSALAAAGGTELAFLALGDAAACALAVLAPLAAGLGAASAAGYALSMTALASAAFALAWWGAARAAAVLVVLAALAAWLAARRVR